MHQYIGEGERFEIIEVLGEGGMGKVFKAYDTQLQEMVAIKSIHKKFNKNDSVINMFLNEAKTSLKITHKHVIRVRDILHFSNNYYLIMEFVDGIDLRHWMKENAEIELRDAKLIYLMIRPIFEALVNAHQYTIHRDIKPTNIMISTKENHIYLMDFGIATVIKGSKIIDVIKEKNIYVGTPSYMPIEQERGDSDIDHRVDIYAMGVIFYELLTQRKPLKENTVFASHFNQSVSVNLDRLILKMLAFNREERYSHVIEIINDMDALFSNNLKEEKHFLEVAGAFNLKNFVVVPEGNFFRGSGLESKIEVEKPRKKIYLDSYHIGIYPVTNREYLFFLKENGNLDISIEIEKLCIDKPNYPVVGVSWDDAMLYCEWIGGKLPTEAQWEKASKGVKNTIYPWGNNFNMKYSNIENSMGQTVSVDSYEEGISSYGCYQMSGNVWEWCQDDFIDDFYKKRASKKENPVSFVKSDTKVIRGGSFNFVHSSARSSYRYYAKRNHKSDNIGFRVVVKGRERGVSDG
jgi:formylglycine-generating enzyme required for sulfatase activity/tRNA A-37 threonylcarbamoyl transferase component Bud32